MIRSMTGFGRARFSDENYNINVEIKSVNHRYFEFSSRITRSYSFLEEKVKSYVNSFVSRGKIECLLTIENKSEGDSEVVANSSLATSYKDAIQNMANDLGLSLSESDIISFLSRTSDIFSVSKKDIDEEMVWNCVKPVIKCAVENFVAMRETEGIKLKEDILSRSDFIVEKVGFIEKRSPETVKEYNEKLKVRIEEFLNDIHVDEQRIATECAIFADKVAVAEETVRLRSHIDQLHTLLDSNEPVGRKLDFLVQEMNRESNTIGSKASDIEIARAVIDIKAEIEKIREQIQNIE